VNFRFVNLGISEDTVDWGCGGTEEILAELLETSTSDGGVEINTLEERVDLNGSLCGRRESTLGTLASCTETTEGASVG
jgi:hypothetical protein